MEVQEFTGKQTPILNLYVISGLVGASSVVPLLPGLGALMESHWRWMASHHVDGELSHPKPALFPWFEFPRGFVVIAACGAGGHQPTLPGQDGWHRAWEVWQDGDGGTGYVRELGTSWKNGMGGK